MPVMLKNEKGLFARQERLSIVDADDFARLSALAASRPCPAAQPWLADLRGVCEDAGSGWGKSKRTLMCLGNMPGGFVNESQPWAVDRSGLARSWEAYGRLREGWAAARSELAAAGAQEKTLAEMDKALPSKAALAKLSKLSVEEREPGWQAKGGLAWAVWMGSERELGYMDGKKRPAGAASARLFESAAAATRTAKAADFGGERGPAAIVRLRVECVAIERERGSPKCDPVRLQMARREAEELRDSLEESSLEQIRHALGEASSAMSSEPAPEPPPAGSLAGREEGFACWVGGQDEGGFLNIRSGTGPLTGALLHANLAKSMQAGWGDMAVVRVACWPEAIEAKIGEPNASSLGAAIAWEQEVARAEALRRQDADALRRRASELESGAAQPRRRARSL